MKQIWFITGAQELYGEQSLIQINMNSKDIVSFLNLSPLIECEVKWMPAVITREQIKEIMYAANLDEECYGIVCWMHTFSPGKMWIEGLQELKRPLCHLHTQYCEDIPYAKIDMDYMNLNQSAHGDREFGYVMSRLGKNRKTIVGYWKNKRVLQDLNNWMKTAIGIIESHNVHVMRISDNMRNVAVTEGDKLEAEIRFGWKIDAYSNLDLCEIINEQRQSDVEALTEEYFSLYNYKLNERSFRDFKESVAVQARMELGIEAFMKEKSCNAFVTNFEDLGMLDQLPGLSVQRLMEKGYGFGAEGDWKTAAMLRIVKQMSSAANTLKGTSFMEDYTYNFEKGEEGILQSHMLEICPSITSGKPTIMVEPLNMGNRKDPARLVFDAKSGKGIVISLIELKNRFRLIVEEVQSYPIKEQMPRLPVARAIWVPEPGFYDGIKAWLIAGGAHHTCFSFDVTAEQMVDWGKHMSIESIWIDHNTDIKELEKELRWNEIYYSLN